MERRIYFMKITLADVEPQVWRHVAVPGAFTLDRLHRVVQVAMGWQNCHLHSFEIGPYQYGEPDPDGLVETRDEMDARIDMVAGKDSRFSYVYDFGDWWEHRIEVEDVLDAETDERYPLCVGGAGECPPEDVGGPYGYQRFREAISDPWHKDHEAVLEWYGSHTEQYDFDPARATAVMRRMA